MLILPVSKTRRLHAIAWRDSTSLSSQSSLAFLAFGLGTGFGHFPRVIYAMCISDKKEEHERIVGR